VTDRTLPPIGGTSIDVFLARQPIFDAAQGLHGYELLHRRGASSAADSNTSPDQMSSEVLVNAFLSIGVTKLVGESRAYINCTRNLLLEGVYQVLNPGQAGLALLESVEPDAAVVAACEDAVSAGFTLALDDFVYRPCMEPLLRLASIVKIDVLNQPSDQLGDVVSALKPFRVELLAEKVESIAVRDMCQRLGFALFQGYFFSRPELISHRELAASPLSILRLLKLLRDETSLDAELEKAFRGNTALTLKLLRVVNSAWIGGRGLDSIRQALLLLGRKELTRWLALLLVTSTEAKDGVDEELMHIVLRRARMCELLAIAMGDRRASDGFFIVGLFSLLDAVLKAPMKDLLAEVDLSADLNVALLEREGDYGRVLSLVEAFDRGAWDDVVHEATRLGIEPGTASEAYADALDWARSRMRACRD
jgi:EAL and modified HD-GYP domain-containing signal transduction protein